ncbi:N-acetylglucosaminyltransferase [Gilvimarinus xylanilyticus]|uniref:N-acetylglucosaminyltransferase n=1 Tax=Gilvimarinus xylanilyticus TaxID=2944139 RepID=A0A9X2HWA3_9GAMM|nr:N-acetylglucosaminyltransferase [Gilvimarinus xylanilyticus]MCP8897751.1 N-acetylglucosaminyltransferase [Gilvimarinus xylanilyticus]
MATLFSRVALLDWRHCLAVLAALWLVGCAQPVVEPPPPEPAPEPAEPKISPAQAKANKIAWRLSRGDRALARDRLLSPNYDNAYDHYQAVLLLESDNREAQLGLQAIVLRYLDMSRSAAQRSRFRDAEIYLDRAASVLPDNAAVQDMVARQREAMDKPLERPESSDSVRLNTSALAARSTEAKAQLATLAQRARSQDIMVLIVAASDAQGRWIYQTMREAVPGYLLRGDIKIGSPARIEFLPPP